MQTRPFRHIATCLLASVLATTGASVAQATDCNALISDLSRHVQAAPNNIVDAIITTNQTNGTATITQNLGLQWFNGGAGLGLYGKGGVQYFNDRSAFAGARDSIGLQVVHGQPVRVSLILETWNYGVMSGNATCHGKLMYGVLDGGETAFTISFRTTALN